MNRKTIPDGVVFLSCKLREAPGKPFLAAAGTAPKRGHLFGLYVEAKTLSIRWILYYRTPSKGVPDSSLISYQ